MRASICLLVAWTVSIACSGSAPPSEPSPADVTPTGAGLFTEGCPIEGQSTARVIQDPASRMRGALAVGQVGDVQIMNTQAAFVITQPGSESTYWYYGGALADAAALDGCSQVTDDLLGDIGLATATLDVLNFNHSRVRGFEAKTIEVVNDGSNGEPALVRATGIDATHWLVEHTLQNSSIAAGDRVFGRDFSLDIVVDYVLAPDSPVLDINIHLQGDEETPETMTGATLINFSDVLDVRGLATQSLDQFGLAFEGGMPWVVASHGEGALAFAVQGTNLGSLNISGVDIAVDLDQALTKPLRPRQTNLSDGARYGYHLAVGPTDGQSATLPLAERHPDPIGLGPLERVAVQGDIRDALDDAPVPDALVEIQVQLDEASGWDPIDVIRADEQGAYQGFVPVLNPSWSYRLSITAPGRAGPAYVPLDPSETEPQTTTLSPRGSLAFQITDDASSPIPARVELTRDNGVMVRHFLFDTGEIALEPGDYTWVATRGWEWTRASGALTVPEGGTGELRVELQHVLDTTGFLSVDSHIHSDPSPDSKVPMAQQLLVGASHGLDVAMATDHEAVVGFEAALERSGLAGHIGIVSGIEMTAVNPEHMTAFPIEPDGSPRGGIVKWYGLGFEEIVDAQKDRGASVVLLNHPGYLNRIGWDIVSGTPSLTDATRLGLSEGSSIWAWNFDGLEVMNGRGSPFSGDLSNFVKWQSMLNHGHAMTAVGSSDDHRGESTGYSRSYFVSSTDDPGQFVESELEAAMQSGAVMMSLGAFLRVEAHGAGLGELASAPDGYVDLAVRVDALPEVQVEHILVWANCDEVARIPTDTPDALTKLDTEVRIPLTQDAHVVVAAFGSAEMPPGLPSVGSATPRAMTNAIYVDTNGNGTFDAPGGKTCAFQL